MPGAGAKIFTGVTKLVSLPIYCVVWLLGSPYLMTLLCIMSEVLVELVVSTVMAGVSLVVSAVILMEEDPRPLPDQSVLQIKSLYGNGHDEDKKHKESSTQDLTPAPETASKDVIFPDPPPIVDTFFGADDPPPADGELPAEDEGVAKEPSKEGSVKSLEQKGPSNEAVPETATEPEKTDSLKSQEKF